MSTRNIVLALIAILLASLACSAPGASPVPAIDTTKIALEIQSTQMSLQMTQAVVDSQVKEEPTPQPPESAPVIDATKISLEIQATQAAAQMTQSVSQVQPATESQSPTEPEPQQNIDDLIKNAKILVYEDAPASNLRPWVQDTLDLMGLKYIYVGTRIGDFMSHLNSGTQWDLIIVAAESRSGVQGEFWDIITPKVTSEKTALIVEMWYLSDIANGRIQSLTSKCGIKFQKVRRDVESIYTLESAHPLFTTPNSGFSLTNYSTYWYDKGGDYVRLTGSGDATLIAGGFPKEKSSYGLLTSCMNGRVVIQTFSSHDYRNEVMQQLWENYIINTLTSHFKSLE